MPWSALGEFMFINRFTHLPVYGLTREQVK